MNRFELPNLGVGLGLRTVHYAHILEHTPPVDWFEIISDNYMHTQGRPLLFLDRIAERYPIVMHGVSLSIGSTDPLDFGYLRELKALRSRTRARWLSDHLCWTGIAGKNSHDLLPLPYTEATLQHVVERVRIVADYLETPLMLENPSTYVEYASSTMPEWEFLNALAERADCGIVLDVNNVYVSAHNHGYEPREYLDNIDYNRVVQFHVAGHTQEGQHLIDTHIGPVVPAVWDLLQFAHARASGASVLIEWDAEIPPFEALQLEAIRARQYTNASSAERSAPHAEDAVA
ncbi:MAG TPA: DUF692 domain-containing protein [Polyangiaceae bacterium]